MKILKYICFALIILNLPAISLFAYGAGVGSMLSLMTIIALIVYYFFEKKTNPNWWLIIITLLYFSISGLQYIGLTSYILYEFIKYLIFIICGYELAKNITVNELYWFLFIGAISIGIEAFAFTNRFGRYSGFYINPNVAGFVCIYGYSVIYGLKSTTLKLIGQFVFTLMGLLTFSRTFIVIWILLNLISIKISIKNIRIFGIGFIILSSLMLIDELVGLNNPRFEQLKNIVNNKNVSTENINEDSRTDTWAKFYDEILDSPIIGNGYGTFTAKSGKAMGVHNSYLVLIGEAGLLPFLIFLAYIAHLYYWSIRFFKRSPNLFMQTIALSIFLLANHNFFNFYYITFAAMWIQYQISKLKKEEFSDEKILEHDTI